MINQSFDTRWKELHYKIGKQLNFYMLLLHVHYDKQYNSLQRNLVTADPNKVTTYYTLGTCFVKSKKTRETIKNVWSNPGLQFEWDQLYVYNGSVLKSTQKNFKKNKCKMASNH